MEYQTKKRTYMKKLVFFSILATLLAFTACSDDNDSSSSNNNSNNNNTNPEVKALAFRDSSIYDIPSKKVNSAITNIDVSGTVSGGKKPYTFSATGLPAGLSISTAGIISGAPTAKTTAGTATITVTDSASTTASITINYGAVLDTIFYNAYVNAIQVTSENLSDVMGDGSRSVSYNPTTNTLTLNNVNLYSNYSTSPETKSYASLYFTADIIINLVGANIINQQAGAANNFGIYGTGSITFTGTGTLSCTSKVSSTTYTGIGIRASSVAFNAAKVSITSSKYAVVATTITAPSTATILGGSSVSMSSSIAASDLTLYKWGQVTVP